MPDAGGHGYQTPSSPSPVSGPGALSKRTDGVPTAQPTGLPQGDAAELAKLQQGPMAQARAARAPIPAVVPLNAPSQFPNEPITHGAPFGPGPGPEALGAQARRVSDMLKMLIGDDISGDIADLLMVAESQGI